MRVMDTTGRLYVVRQSWREFEPSSALPSAGPLPEAKTEGMDSDELALLYRGAVVYVQRAYCEEVKHAA